MLFRNTSIMKTVFKKGKTHSVEFEKIISKNFELSKRIKNILSGAKNPNIKRNISKNLE